MARNCMQRIILIIMVVIVASTTTSMAVLAPNPLDAWTVRYRDSRQHSYTVAFNAVVYGGGQFVAVGDNGMVATSPDGVAWTLQDGIPLLRDVDRDPTIPLYDNKTSLYGIAYGNGMYVAVGDSYDNTTDNSRNGIYTSPDGITWTLVSHSYPGPAYYTFPSAKLYGLRGITYANGQFVAVGGPSIVLVSSDGTNWTEHDPGTSQLEAVIYADGKYVSVGGSYIGTSTNGRSWSIRATLPAYIGLTSVSYGNDRFVAKDFSNGYFANSPDGIGWTTSQRDDNYGGTVSYSYGKFIDSLLFGIVSTSEDGLTWTDMNLGGTVLTQQMYGIAHGNGTVVMVGKDANDKGVIVQSGQIFLPLSVTVIGSGSLHSSPGTISCTSGPCGEDFLGGTSVNLLPTSSFGSFLSGWSGNCSGQGSCTVVVDKAKDVTATFAVAPPVRIAGTVPQYFQTLQAGYGASSNGDLIQLKEGTLAGGLTAANPVSVAIRGGYDAGYTTPATGTTTVTGSIFIRAGTLIFDRLILKQPI